MKEYQTEQIRNVVVLGHGGTGKTTFTEAALFSTGAITRMGKVDDGTTTSDHDPDETKRQISVSLSVLPCEVDGVKINLIDTPGYADFQGEVKQGVRAADAALIVVDAVSGVEVGTDLAWSYADEASLPRFVLVNRMDRENADFAATVSQLQEHFGKQCVPLHVPIGSQDDFEGIADLLEMKAYRGDSAEEGDIPESLGTDVSTYREQLIEAIAETDDDLINKYLEGEELSVEELRAGLHTAVCSGSVVPILAAASNKGVGVLRVLNALARSGPSPADRAETVARDGSDAEVKLTADPAGPLAVLAFKTSADQHVGKITLLRVVSGTMKSDSHVFNANRKSDERIGHPFYLRGKTQEPTAKIVAGDIGAVAKLAETHTGDTLCERDHALILEPIEFPTPSYSLAVYPKTKGDLDKLGPALSRVTEEDPSLRVHRDADTNETILSGLGESHIDVTAERMKRKFGVEVDLETPKVPYRVTITGTTKTDYTHKKQSGGHGQFARVAIELSPQARSSGFEFTSSIVGGSVPKQYISAVEKGVEEAMQEGILAGFPLVDVKVNLYDGKEHSVDSSEMAFKIASAQALKQSVRDAHPILLEPIVNLRVTVPESYTGDVLSDLNSKRGKVQGMTPQGKLTVVEAQAPLAEVQRYATDLRSLTQGRAVYTMEQSHYEEVPAHISQKIIAAAEGKEDGESE